MCTNSVSPPIQPDVMASCYLRVQCTAVRRVCIMLTLMQVFSRLAPQISASYVNPSSDKHWFSRNISLEYSLVLKYSSRTSWWYYHVSRSFPQTLKHDCHDMMLSHDNLCIPTETYCGRSERTHRIIQYTDSLTGHHSYGKSCPHYTFQTTDSSGHSPSLNVL